MNAQPHTTEARELFKEAERLREAGEHSRAVNLYIQVTFRAPRHWLAFYKAGVLLIELGRAEAGLAALRRAAAIVPDNANVRVALGLSLKNHGRQEEAEHVMEETLALEPDNLYALFHKAELLLRTNRTEAALALFDRLVEGERDVENIKAVSRWLRGVARLTLGDYQAAWADYEARVHHPTTTFPELQGERWTGQPLDGKTVFLAYEQRFGDVIQFSRFVPRLVERGARVILQTPHELMRLFRSLGEGVELIEYKDAVPPYDYCQLVTSIPAILDYTREGVGSDAYLDVEPGTPPAALPLRGGTHLKVGLVWAGKPVPDRSIPLAYYAPLLARPEVSFYSFQLGDARGEMKTLALDWLIRDLSEQIADFHDSAVLMKDMDLIVTIDTAAAHQAGALGVPTWLMLIYYSDWRWGRYGDSATAWYPSIRIFRQHAYRDWSGAADELARAFDTWVDERSTRPPGYRTTTAAAS